MNITNDGDMQTLKKLQNNGFYIKDKTILDMLKECQYFIWEVPNKKYQPKSYKDSYQLASELGKLIKQLEK